MLELMSFSFHVRTSMLGFSYRNIDFHFCCQHFQFFIFCYLMLLSFASMLGASCRNLIIHFHCLCFRFFNFCCLIFLSCSSMLSRVSCGNLNIRCQCQQFWFCSPVFLSCSEVLSVFISVTL